MQRPPLYPGEDTRPTSKKELYGWYAYGLAAEVFAVCGVGSFLPVTLEQLSREAGVLRSDGSTPCIAPNPGAALMSRAFKRDDEQCIVRIFGSNVSTASFAMYTFSAAVLVQALTLISISAFADYGTSRKRLLLTFSFTGATASMLFLFMVPKIFLMASLLVIVGVTCLGSSFVLLNSFLPLLSANSPGLKSSVPMTRFSGQFNEEDPDDTTVPQSTIGIESTTPADIQAQLAISTDISSKGIGIGYAAAVFVQLLSVLVLLIFSKVLPSGHSATIPLRVVLLIVGLWWAGFTIPTAIWLRPRPGPPLPQTGSMKRRWCSWVPYVLFAWSALWKTVKTVAKLRQATIFLIAWFFLSDATATVSGTAILFARTELHMGTVPIALLSIVATASGFSGAFCWPLIARRLKLNSNQTILTCIALFEIIPLYGLLGYVPFIKSWGVGGLQKSWEIFPLGFVHGFVMGGLSSYCRSFFGQMIPPGREAAFYALYAVTDKGSSAVGPAIVGRLVDTTGTVRSGFWFLAVLILIPLPLIWYVDVERGRMDAMEMAGITNKGRSFREEESLNDPDGSIEQEGLLSNNI